MNSFEFIQGEQGLLDLRPEWEALFARLPVRVHAQSWTWVSQQIRCLEADPPAVGIALLRRQGEVVALVPLRAEARAPSPFAPARWSLLWDPHSTLSPALIAPELGAVEALEAIVRELRRQGMRCDWLSGPSLLDDGRWGAHGQGVPAGRVVMQKLRPSMRFCTTAPGSALAESSAHFRQNLGRQRRKLQAQGQVELHIAKGVEAAGEAFEDFLGIEASGWKGDGGTASAIALHDGLRSFYAGVIDASAPSCEVWIATLRLDGRAVASNFCMRTGSTLGVLKIGYDESLKQAAPGNVLLSMLIDACTEDPGISELSLVTGPAWAERWCPQRVDVYRVEVFASSLRGRITCALRGLRRALRERRR